MSFNSLAVRGALAQCLQNLKWPPAGFQMAEEVSPDYLQNNFLMRASVRQVDSRKKKKREKEYNDRKSGH